MIIHRNLAALAVVALLTLPARAAELESVVFVEDGEAKLAHAEGKRWKQGGSQPAVKPIFVK